ncbi:WD40-repeat-containing domain protein [Ilyonectria sp. MPI-CAGE-AT-0026]|nr:WD40-repeat-containing domain protein [Ilyonectria sp. MPI-CAGE-AT-0026]
MDSPASPVLSNRSVPQNPLHVKIRCAISDAPQDKPPKEVFVECVWPKLAADYGSMVQELIKYCNDQLGDKGIPAKVEGRAKSQGSIRDTLERREQHRMKQKKGPYRDMQQILDDMHDLAGLRIVVDYPSDMDKTNQFIKATFEAKKTPNEFSRDRPIGKLWETWFGAYESFNHHVTLKSDTLGIPQIFCEVMFEIQLTSLPETLYNRLAHPLMYKKPSQPLSRNDEIVIDISHGLALCYSMCQVYMQDKLEGPTRSLNDNKELRDAMRKAVPALGAEPAEVEMDALVELTAPIIGCGYGNKPGTQDNPSSKLKRRGSFGKAIPIESLLNALSTLSEECDSNRHLWASLTDKMKDWGLNIKAVESAIQHQTQLLLKMSLDEEDRKCLKDLHIINPETHKTQIENTKGGLLKDSYRWILQHSDFQRFRNDPESRLLWIKGDPGKGKTMLLCGIIDELKKEPSLVVSYFFCQATEDHARSATSVIRGLIWLLCTTHPTLTSYVRKRYDVEGRKLFDDSCAWASLEGILTDILQGSYLQDAIFVVDALDECSDKNRVELVDLLVKLSSSSRAKWIVSSRNWPTIEEQLRDAEKIRVHLEVNQDSIAGAVKTFVHYKVDQLAHKKGYKSETKQAVLDRLLLKANDTFLWVALVCKELARPQVKSRHTLSKLDSVPAGLDDLYERMLGQILKSEDAGICTRILATSCIAYRPVSLDELRVLVLETQDLSREDLEEIIGECGSFLTIQDDIVYFVHQSAQTFLMEKGCDVIFPSGIINQNHIMFRRSLDALAGLERDMYRLQSPGILIDEISQPQPNPLSRLCYSTVYWVDHLGQTKNNISSSDCEDIEEFMGEKFLYWLEALSLQRKTPEGARAIGKLRDIMQQNTADAELNSIIEDARRFVLSHRAIIEIAPLQVYASALIFSPTDSLVRNMYEKEEPDWLKLKPRMKRNWDTCIQTLESRSGEVFAVALSHDGQRLASAARTGVDIWNVASSHCIRSLEIEDAGAVDFSVDGQHLAAGSDGGGIGLWNVDSGVHVQTLHGHYTAVNDVAFSPDGKLLASASDDQTIKMWDFKKGECIRTMHGHKNWVRSLSFSADGRQLASGGHDHTVRVWETATGSCIWPLRGHKQQVTSVAFLSGDSLASGSDDETVRIWDVTTGICIRTLQGHDLDVISIVFLEKGLSLASASSDGMIRIWDDTGACVQTLDHRKNAILSLAFSANNQLLASASSNTTKIWDMAAHSAERPFEHHVADYIEVAISPNGKWVGSVSENKTVKLWNAFNGTCVHTFEHCHEGDVALVFSPDSQHFLSFLALRFHKRSSTVKVWDTAEGRCVKTFEGIIHAAFFPDSKRLALAEHKSVHLWDIDTRVFIQKIEIQTNFITVSPDSTYIGSSSGAKVEVWDILRGHRLHNFQTNHHVLSVAMSRDPRWIAARTEKNILVWDIHTGTLLHRLPSVHNLHSMVHMTISPNSRWIAICSWNSIKIWDLNAPLLAQSIEPSSKCNHFHFDATHNSQLSTGVGVLDLDKILATDAEQNNTTWEPQYHGCGFSRDGAWILRGSQRILWLPEDYRSYRSMASASTVVIGTDTRDLRFMQFGVESSNLV